MSKIYVLLFSSMFLAACMGGQQYRVDMDDGSYYVVEDIGHANMARNGMQYGRMMRCDASGVCETVAESTSVNGAMLGDLAGAGATVGAAALIGSGLRDSGDNVNVNSNSSNNVGVKVKNGNKTCQGNCK